MSHPVGNRKSGWVFQRDRHVAGAEPCAQARPRRGLERRHPQLAAVLGDCRVTRVDAWLFDPARAQVAILLSAPAFVAPARAIPICGSGVDCRSALIAWVRAWPIRASAAFSRASSCAFWVSACAAALAFASSSAALTAVVSMRVPMMLASLVPPSVLTY